MAAWHQANEPKRNAQKNTHYVNDRAYRGLVCDSVSGLRRRYFRLVCDSTSGYFHLVCDSISGMVTCNVLRSHVGHGRGEALFALYLIPGIRNDFLICSNKLSSTKKGINVVRTEVGIGIG